MATTVCRTIKTPDPSTLGLEAFVDEKSLQPLAGNLPPEGTTFGSELWRNIFPRDYYKLYKDFIYIGQGQDDRNGIWLNFSKPKTEQQIATPFRVTTDFKDFYWDTILLALVFIEDPLGRSGAYITSSGAGVAVGHRYRVREVYIPGGKFGTLFTTREYFSPRPIRTPQYETPVPRAVTYDVPGARGGFPSCIGPKITIPNLETGIISAVAGSVSGVGGSLKGQVFPETNVIDWEPRVIDFQQKLTAGGYYAVEISVTPPEQPDINIS